MHKIFSRAAPTISMKTNDIPVKDRIILDLCGGTGSWAAPYKAAGYDVRTITLPGYDVTTYVPPVSVWGILAAPPCTMFSLARTNAKKPRDFREGMETVHACLKIIWECRAAGSLKWWALENPRCFLRQFMGKPPFQFMHCEFGDDAGKPTDLWGYYKFPRKTHPGTKPTCGRDNTESRWYNKTKSKRHLRALTPPGFAKAFFEANR